MSFKVVGKTACELGDRLVDLVVNEGLIEVSKHFKTRGKGFCPCSKPNKKD
jgi:hypothetical protein